MMELLLLVLAMAVVTYLPRMAPMTFMRNMNISPVLRRFFRFIPYAALEALIFPGIITSAGPERIPSALVGTVAAVGLAWMTGNVMLVVAGGIAGVFLANMLL